MAGRAHLRLAPGLILGAAVLSIAGCGRTHGLGHESAAGAGGGVARILVDQSKRYQTIAGWEATAEAGQNDSPAFAGYRATLFDQAVNDLGITRLRAEIRSGAENTRDYWSELRAGRLSQSEFRPLQYSTVNDNADPHVIDERGFQFSALDSVVRDVVVPMRAAARASGRTLDLNVNYVGFTRQIGRGLEYAHDDPEEYAEFVEATFLHLQREFGFVPDAWEIELEPDNALEHWPPDAMRDRMIAAAARLNARGFAPAFIAPSTTNMANALKYARAIAAGGAPRFWTELSYHRYSGVSDATLADLASEANALGLRTAMLEHIGSGYEDLHADLKTGNASAWQQYTLAYPITHDDGSAYYLIDDRDRDHPRVMPSASTRFLRQYFHYIRPHAVRIGALTSTATVDPLAFVNADGKTVVVAKTAGQAEFEVDGLPPGTYDVTYTTAADAAVDCGSQTIGERQMLHARIPARGVVTVAAR